MSKNHYVPMFILRNFDEKISTYNLKPKSLTIKKSIKKSFVEKNLYPDEIEKMFNEEIENSAAITLRKKILIQGNHVTITRKELNLLMKFLLLQMFRTDFPFNDDSIEEFRVSASKLHKFNESIEYKELDHKEYWMKTLKCVLECSDISKIKKDTNATALAVCFAEAYYCSYIGIWDSSDCCEDFIIMDQGMTSEHELLSEIYGDVMKRGYLIPTIIKNEPGRELNFKYSIYKSNFDFHENFYFHTVSKNRIIVLINPFFGLYDIHDSIERGYKFDEPNIWPTKISDKSLVQKPIVKYMKPANKTSLEDEFTYEVKQLKLRDTVFVNAITLDRINEVVGFANLEDVRRSLLIYNSLGIKRKEDYSCLISEMAKLGYNTIVTDEMINIGLSITNRPITRVDVECCKNFKDLFSKMNNNKMV